jgi:hypothetical protein
VLAGRALEGVADFGGVGAVRSGGLALALAVLLDLVLAAQSRELAQRLGVVLAAGFGIGALPMSGLLVFRRRTGVAA